MGLMDSIIGQVGTALSNSQSQNEGLLEMVTYLINNPETGGLQGLINTFKEKGLGDAVASWVGTGQNQPITGDQIKKVLDSDLLQNLAQKFGMSPDTVSTGLAQMLPQVIDKLTPNGQLPENSQLIEQGMALLKGKLFG